MRIAYGFYTADSGEILLTAKRSISEIRTTRLRLGIGMVHQHFMLVDTMTVAENIILGAETGGAAISIWKRRIRDILALSNELRLGVNPRALDRRHFGRRAAASRASQSALSQSADFDFGRADRRFDAAGSRRFF
jgi:ABC-type ATPase involved in cell division